MSNSQDSLQVRTCNIENGTQEFLLPNKIINTVSLINDSLTLNCDGKWRCARIQCHVGPFHGSNAEARVDLRATLNTTVLSK
jgi:hypothetical protein